MHGLVNRKRSPGQRDRSTQQIEIRGSIDRRPIHQNHGIAQGANQRPEHFPVEQRALELKLAITEQAIHALDRMLDVGRAWQAPAKAGQSQTVAAQQGGDATHQRG